MNNRTILWALALGCLATLPAAGQARAANHGNTWIIADFNGDHTPDLVTLNAIPGSAPEIQPGEIASAVRASWHAFPMQRLRARDLDGDSDQDLVLETFTSVAIAVWINDGTGHFERANLEDFRFQLSREQSHECSEVGKPSPSELVNQSPRGDEVPPAAGVFLSLSAPNVIRGLKQYVRTPFPSDIGSRGPPFIS